MPENGGATNGAVAKAEVHGLKERFEDCRADSRSRLEKLEVDMEKVKGFQNRLIGVLVVVQFLGFGGLAVMIWAMLRHVQAGGP